MKTTSPSPRPITNYSTQSELEDGLRKRAQDALDHAQGPGKTHVTVSAALNFDSLIEKSETLDPERKSPRKVEQKDTNRISGIRGERRRRRRLQRSQR